MIYLYEIKGFKWFYILNFLNVLSYLIFHIPYHTMFAKNHSHIWIVTWDRSDPIYLGQHLFSIFVSHLVLCIQLKCNNKIWLLIHILKGELRKLGSTKIFHPFSPRLPLPKGKNVFNHLFQYLLLFNWRICLYHFVIYWF